MKQIDLRGLTFAELREEDKYYVDKTLLIKDILGSDDRGVYLFTRPRRFGKTTNLSMLDAFFNIEFKGNTWFDGLAISDYPEFEKYKNAFPVIRLNLAGTKTDTYESHLCRMQEAVRDAYEHHRYLLDDENLDAVVRSNFGYLDRMNMPESILPSSIRSLSGAVFKATGIKPIILIDEYDAAATYSCRKEPYEKIVKLLMDFLEASLKTNENRQMCYMTGVMRIADHSIFPGFNNVSMYDIFSKLGDERFGFTAEEVKGILEYYGNPKKYREAKRWYDGYRFGNAEVYNPYSVMNYVSRGFEPKPYWIDSGSDILIMQLLTNLNNDTYADVLELVAGGSIETEVDGRLAYWELETPGGPPYSLMAVSGYLKAVPVEDGRFRVSVPDGEVRDAVRRMLQKLYPVSDSAFDNFNRAVLDGDADTMVSVLQRIVLHSSYMNLAENTYRAVMLTIMHGLSEMYDVSTECGEGGGRIDIILRSRVRGRENMIFEIKAADSEEKLDAKVDEAIRQIRRQRYYQGMPGKVILIGLAFWVKVPKGRVEIIDNGPDGTAMLGKFPEDR